MNRLMRGLATRSPSGPKIAQEKSNRSLIFVETAVRCKAPVVALVWRDNTYGLIKWKQLNDFGRASYVDFGNPDFVGLARSFGWEAHRLEAANELQPALEQALRSPGPVLIETPVDYSENTKLTERLGKLVCPM